MVISSKIDCRDITEIHSILQRVEENPSFSGNLYILFTGSKSPDTGKSWCPDCVRGEPLIMQGLSQISDSVTLVVVDVEREPYRSQDYSLRRDPRINLRCVPTLMKWEKGQAVLRLNDVQCQNVHAVDEFLST